MKPRIYTDYHGLITQYHKLITLNSPPNAVTGGFRAPRPGSLGHGWRRSQTLMAAEILGEQRE